MTIAEIAKVLDIPESTARYYRDSFIDYIPSVGEGRKKRYRPEASEVLRFIAEGFKRKLTAKEIEYGLSQMFPRNFDIEDTTAITSAATQQQSENEVKQYALQLQSALEQMTKTMQVIANQKEEIVELRNHVADLEKKQQDQQDYINKKLEDRDLKLIQSLKESQEAKKLFLEVKEQIAAAKEKKSWWQKLWRG
ncbi:MerR family transcriptional regulator [Actinomadura geliboluensis]|uniref:MerR family transcriptional regulator n=1 Tax=Actinomadura geliboluensis TaxID=882440 RepID=UPI00031749C1|nr:MerR family transcriptional regulator [Actinomadura geliboluensis]